MCRLLAYLGPPLAIEDFLLMPEHSLMVQSYAPREMTGGTLNADGYGFAWYDSSVRAAPFLYRTILPIWNDSNLSSLAPYIRSGCVVANVRSATPGQSLDMGNTQPFVAGRLSAIHNGRIEDFRSTLYRIIRQGIGEDAYAALGGNTDSEHLFAWILHHIEGGDLAGGVVAAFAELAAIAPDARMTLNVIVSDGHAVVATRHARHEQCPSLYWLDSHRRFPDAVVVASEPLFDDPSWRPVPPHSLLVAGGGAVSIRPLASDSA